MILCLFTFIVQSAYFITIIACPTSSKPSFPPFSKTMNLQNPNNGENNQTSEPDLQNPNNGSPFHPNQIPPYTEEIDSSCSTPYVSAPSSPGRSFNSSSNTSNISNGYFFSCPASPVHFILSSKFTPSSSPSSPSKADPTVSGASFEFEFSGRFPSNNTLTSADELFFNGQIRPMKLSSHLQKPQILAPLVDEEDEKEIAEEDSMMIRGRDLRLRNRSLHRRTRSLSPLRNQIENHHHHHHHHQRNEVEEEAIETPSTETTPSSSRSSSSGSRNSKRWVFLKDFLRSKSEGRGNSKEKFWSSISFSPATKEKEKKGSTSSKKSEQAPPPVKKANGVKPMNGVSKRRVPQSAHEVHYTTNRAQAEEMKKRTYLPYKQGLFGCLGFNSKSYGAFARALNPVSSR